MSEKLIELSEVNACPHSYLNSLLKASSIHVLSFREGAIDRLVRIYKDVVHKTGVSIIIRLCLKVHCAELSALSRTDSVVSEYKQTENLQNLAE